jgi:hypothetical protein
MTRWSRKDWGGSHIPSQGTDRRRPYRTVGFPWTRLVLPQGAIALLWQLAPASCLVAACFQGFRPPLSLSTNNNAYLWQTPATLLTTTLPSETADTDHPGYSHGPCTRDLLAIIVSVKAGTSVDRGCEITRSERASCASTDDEYQ